MNRLFACLLLAGVSAPLSAQEVPDTIKLSVRANAAPVPALKARLLPDPAEMRPGNAAIDYYRGFSPEYWGNLQRQPVKYWEDLTRYASLPLDELRRTDLNQYPLNGGMMSQVDRGARREYCDWELAPRVAEDGVATLIPDVQGMRNYAYILAVRARRDLTNGKIDRALYSLQTGLRLAKHVGESHSSINILVGVACGMQMLQQVDQLVQLDQSPNLYWALSQLPRPFIDPSRALMGEELMLNFEMKGIQELEKGPVSAEEAQKVFDKLIERAKLWARTDRKDELQNALALVPTATEGLIRSGRQAAEVNRMPPLQIVMLWAKAETDRMRHDQIKWLSLPFAEGYEGLKRASAAHETAKKTMNMLPVLSDLVSTYDRVAIAGLRMDRKIAALRCVEAIKLHVADNGEFPKSLGTITAAPVPLDPMVNKPFEYSLNGQTAIVTAPTYGTSKANGLRYEITIRK